MLILCLFRLQNSLVTFLILATILLCFLYIPMSFLRPHVFFTSPCPPQGGSCTMEISKVKISIRKYTEYQ